MGVGQIALTGTSAFFAGASADPVTITTTILSALGDVNEAMRSLDAGSANIANSFFDRNAIAVADQTEALDAVFKSRTWGTISSVNTVVSFASGLSDITQTLGRLDDAATLLDKYSHLFSPATLSMARLQLLSSVNALYGLTSDYVTLNEIASKITGSSQSQNKPYIPETIDVSSIPSLPQRK
jgi:hypothetical protein